MGRCSRGRPLTLPYGFMGDPIAPGLDGDRIGDALGWVM
jgi:hypothetical protein